MGLLFLGALACGAASEAPTPRPSVPWGTESSALRGPKVGVLIASYGDVDSPDEAEDFVKRCVADPDIAPIPAWLRPVVPTVGWWLEGKKIKDEYRAIGGAAGLRQRAREQAEGTVARLKTAGVDAHPYSGFVFTTPFIQETLRTMQRDGIEEFVLLYQGAQYSKVTQWINMREVNQYLKEHPEWDVRAVAVKSFSDDPRFRSLLRESIATRIRTSFADGDLSHLCIFLPMHGVPSYLPEGGDPAYAQMLRAVDDVRKSFPLAHVGYGFQNHDEFPGSRWTEPRHDKAVRKLVEESACDDVLINGRISFTADCLETLYDHGVNERNIVLETRPHARVTVEPMFNSEPSFLQFTADLVLEALNGEGDLATLR